MKKLIWIIIMVAIIVQAQKHPYQKTKYDYPEDPQVREQLEQWQNLKFGLMMHWGLYSQLGVVESWGLCSEDQSFQDRGGMPYTEYKEMYFDLIKKFNPQKFDPEPWAKAAKDAGMKYLVFGTKHHDGFSMFDTKQTDFKITGKESPFRNHPKANVAKEVFGAFRNEGFMIGAYFSKPDWHHPAYWTPLLATPNRCNNYDVRKYPELWQEFKDFTYNQIEELMTEYGDVDILWLDGGWVRPNSTINEEVISWGYDIPEWEQDIDIPRIAKMARKNQPGLLVVDRTVHGLYENYRTPEQSVPDEILPFPWETCMTMTQAWGHSYKPNYKSTRKLVHTLVDVVAKGGNYLLNVGPTPEGTFEEEAYKRLREIGEWMKVNSEAIYDSRPIAPYKEGQVCFTQNINRKVVYAIYLAKNNENTLPAEILIRGIFAQEESQVKMLGFGNVEWEKSGDGMKIIIPENVTKNPPCKDAWTFKFTIE